MRFGLGQIARKAGRWIPPALLRHAGQPTALFFHGVEPGIVDPLAQENHHEAADFRAILTALRRHGFQVLPLEALDEVLAQPERHRRSVFLMSDDGYRNTLTAAADILEEFAMPWTLFVSTGHVGTGRPHPAFLCRLFFMHAPAGSHTLPNFPHPVHLGDAETREKWAQSGLDHLRFLPAQQAEETLAAMRAAFAPDALAAWIAQFPSEHFLDWNEVRALARRGVTIGAHADSHWPMHAAQDEAWLRRQAADAKAKIEAEIGPCRFFAYPFGNKPDVGPLAWRAVRDAGYSHAFTTLSGTLAAGRTRAGPRAADGNPWLLPRYGLGPRDSHIASLIPLLCAGNSRVRAWQRALA